MRVLVVTVGTKYESLGALKLIAWLRREGCEVSHATTLAQLDYDRFCFSVVFSWKLPIMVQMIAYIKQVRPDAEIWVGGPAVTFHPANARYVQAHTGIIPVIGLDPRFDTEGGQYPMTYFSRGCPAYTPACGLCPVPKIEGNQFRYYPNAAPAKLLLDNNLSALPSEYQAYIITQYAKLWRGGAVDANSGFEPHSFTEQTFDRWQKFPLLCWRFGYDDLTERDQAIEMMNLLRRKGLSGQRVRVYTLIGNEPMSDCIQRIKEVIHYGFHPWPQRRRPLDWLGGPLPCLFDWDEPTLIAYQRFYSIAGLWKYLKPEEFYYQSRYPLRQT